MTHKSLWKCCRVIHVFLLVPFSPLSNAEDIKIAAKEKLPLQYYAYSQD